MPCTSPLDASTNAQGSSLGRIQSVQAAPTLRFAGTDWILPNELPWAFVEASSGDVQGIVRALQGLLADQWSAFSALNPSIADVMVLVEAIPGLYGLEGLGEAGASQL